jgi:hypothetical protein
MASDEEFRALQERVGRLERVLTGVDADVAAIQAQRRADLELLMALRGTQLSQDERISKMEETVTVGFQEMRASFQAVTELITQLLPGDQ